MIRKKKEADEKTSHLQDETVKSEKKTKPKKTKIEKIIAWKRAFLIALSCCFLLFSSGMFILYGPWAYVRDTLITTAMTTMTHQYLARWFYSDETIERVMSEQIIVEPDEDTNPDLIDPDQEEPIIYENEYERQVLEREEGAIYKIIPIDGSKINGGNYKGYLVAVYDPSKIHIVTTKYLGRIGQSTKVMARDNNALIAINASGFYDPDWNSNGSTPHGTIIKDGKIIWDYADANVGGGFIGFTYDDKLVLGRMSAQQALNMGMRDAIEFGPFLIVNGERAFVQGNGGWGIAPRSAIGQRSDGIVLMLIIDGRQPGYSIGADLVDVTEVMYRYGAINAANLDGGSSSSLIVNGDVYSRPVAGGEEGLRNLPTAWIVTEE